MYSQIASNKRRTWLIMLGFIVLVGVIAWIFGLYFKSPDIFYAALIGSIVYAWVMYYAGSRLSLAVNGAHEIAKKDNPRLWRIVENLAITDGLPMPRVFIMDDPAPNAFATGRKPEKAAVCATSGLLEIMNDTELEGVMAHEMGHVKNYDMRVSMIAFAMAAVIGILADIILRMTLFRSYDRENNGNPYIILIGLLAAILAPIIALLIQMSISRRREYLADATGALTTRYPDGLANALEKLERVSTVTRRHNSSTAHLFFANPLRAHGLNSLFSTHPPLVERVKRLRAMDTHS